MMEYANQFLAIDIGTLPQQLVNGTLLGAIYALIALGYTMVYGVLRLINFAHGEVFMLGAYFALFTSWVLGFSPEALQLFPKEGTYATLLIMMLVSMVGCAIVGVLIELLAYRPLRDQPRLSVLITAIGVSLLLQHGGAMFLPNTPQPSISEQANPLRETQSFYLWPPNPQYEKEADAAKKVYLEKEDIFQKRLQHEMTQLGKISEFDLTPEGQKLRKERQLALREYRDQEAKVEASSVKISIFEGQLAMLIVTILLMIGLRQLVLKTSVGRAMRAVSHDFVSASLMGINVNRIITITFLIGSALAGAGAMMNATFMGTPLNTFYGMLPGIKAFVAAVLGGIGNIAGAVLGGLLMGIAETLVIWLGGSSYKDAVAFVILIAILLCKPGGLLGSSKVEKV